MNRFSRRYIDLNQYKTKEILIKVLTEREIDVQPSNKAETFYEALCPFHKEKTPSFKLHNNTFYKTWGYKCFGCGRCGDVFRFLELYEKWPFWDGMLYVVKGKVFQYSKRNSSIYQIDCQEDSNQLSLGSNFPIRDIFKDIEEDENLPF